MLQRKKCNQTNFFVVLWFCILLPAQCDHHISNCTDTCNHLSLQWLIARSYFGFVRVSVSRWWRKPIVFFHFLCGSKNIKQNVNSGLLNPRESSLSHSWYEQLEFWRHGKQRGKKRVRSSWSIKEIISRWKLTWSTGLLRSRKVGWTHTWLTVWAEFECRYAQKGYC